MEQQQCLGSTDGDSLATSPMPVIGVYIAASTLVCLLFLLIDICQGFRRSKHLIPTKFFSLNSLTLTLLGISTKLPVDLTSGPVSITIAMGFFTPSLGDMKGSELLGNMISLTIVVFTVIVNVIIQMSTGVIFSFYLVEHVLSLSLMLLTLVAMWYVAYVKNWVTGLLGDVWRREMQRLDDEDPFTTDDVKCLCDTSSVSTPQFALCCCTNYLVYVDFLCIISLGTLVEACVRTFFLKHLNFCSGESDYKWSLWIVVASQILTALIGTLAITYRSFFRSCLLFNKYVEVESFPLGDARLLIEILASRDTFARFERFREIARRSVSIQGLLLEDSVKGLVILVHVLEELGTYFFYGVYIIMGWADYAAHISLSCIAKGISCISRNTLDPGSISNFLQSKIDEDIENFVENCKKEEPLSLIQLLQDTQPSQFSRLDEEYNGCLLVVLLVRVASIKLPDLGHCLVDSLSEIFDTLYFIDHRSSSSAFHENLNIRVAKEIWMTRGLSDHWFQKKILSSLQKNCCSSDFDFSALLDEHMLDKGTRQLSQIVNLWKQGYTDEVVGVRLNQLFLDIMYFLLPQFPKIMADYIIQCPVAEIEKRSKTAMKFECKYESLVSHVEWLSSEIQSDQSAQGDYVT